MKKILISIAILNFSFNLNACYKDSEHEDYYTELADLADAEVDKRSKKENIDALVSDMIKFFQISNEENIRTEEIVTYMLKNEAFKNLFKKVKETKHREIAQSILLGFDTLKNSYPECKDSDQYLLSIAIKTKLCMECQCMQLCNCVIL